ncbi:hypothetical protein BJG92_02809 [Arthrobacter sp. SO5]|nr:hypothetical protein [Arthrobacter sp. SO5]
MADVPGSAEGLAEAVAEGLDDALAEDGTAAAVDDEPEGAGPGAAGVQAARAAINVPAASTETAARVRSPKTFTGTFLLVLTPDSASSLVSPGA